jgi:SNF2 family DNA or RNA helicase
VTTTAVEEVGVSVPRPLYHSPRGLYDFQVRGVAYCYERLDNLAAWDTGIGKTHLAMATAAMLFEDERLDHALVICEKNKVDEWLADFRRFTDLDAALYYGTPKKREKIRKSLPQVLISTYETARNDAGHLVKVEGRKTKKLVPHVLTEVLAGKRVMVVYDEMTKLGNRGSNNHKAHDLLVQTLRSGGVDARVLGLTATPIERNPENFYNLGRILAPWLMPTVAGFERDYIKTKDIFGTPVAFKNLSRDDCDPGVTPFVDVMRPVLLRKRKTDPDVIDQFPKTVEEITYVRLGDRHQEFYETVKDVFADADEMTQKVLFTTMRQIAAHPLALLRSQGQISRAIVEQVGEEGLRALGSAKTDRLVEYLVPLVKGQGAQVVVFTFFGPSVIPLLQEALEAEGISCALNHGQMRDADRKRDKEAFKAGRKSVFLTSDAGARGINLPEALYVLEFEMALTHANRTQRLNRIHRIDSTHPSVTFQTFIALDTVEEGIARGVLRRNEWSDALLDDDDPGEDFVSAADRKRLLSIARARAV